MPVEDTDGNTIKNNVVAHRGAWKKNKLPENSIASLGEAIRLKCIGSEFDINITSDDSIVICHDPTYGGKTISTTKYSDLIKLKLSNGEKLPTLYEYINFLKTSNSKTKLFCEFKSYSLSKTRKATFIFKTIEMIRLSNKASLMVLTSFDYDILKQLRSLNKDIHLQYLSGDVSPQQLYDDRISGIDYTLGDYIKNSDWVTTAKKLNLKTNIWTINLSSQMDWAILNQFDFITTDEPELLLSKN
jgi:glycerophosphoryl diester phosphodiesterase